MALRTPPQPSSFPRHPGLCPFSSLATRNPLPDWATGMGRELSRPPLARARVNTGLEEHLCHWLYPIWGTGKGPVGGRDGHISGLQRPSISKAGTCPSRGAKTAPLESGSPGVTPGPSPWARSLASLCSVFPSVKWGRPWFPPGRIAVQGWREHTPPVLRGTVLPSLGYLFTSPMALRAFWKNVLGWVSLGISKNWS